MRGPPPTPTVLKLLRGNPGKRPIRPEPEPEIPPQVPEPPEFLIGYAVEEWRRVAPQLHHLRILTILDVQPLAAYCSSYARWRTAEEVLRKMAEKDAATGGLLIKRADGNAGQNPLVKISRDSAEAMVQYAGHFGMSAVARARISAGVGHEPPSRFDGLLGRD
jgi:P27 family predicted phage terminase small subunit